MGRKKINEAEKKQRIVLYVKKKYHKKIKDIVTKTLQDNERISDPKEN